MSAPAQVAGTPTAALRPDVHISGPRYRGERTVHLVRDDRSGRVYEFGVREAFLIDQLAAGRPAVTIRQEYADRFRRTLAPASWGHFLGLLGARGLLAGDTEDQLADRVSPQARPSSLRAGRWVFAPLPGGLSRVHRAVAWTFAPWFLIPAAVAVAAMLGWLAREVAADPNLVVDTPKGAFLVILIPLCWVSLTIHEFGHGIAATHFGGQATEMGLLLRPPTLFLYCRVDGSGYVTSRRAQVAVALAGVWVNLVTLLPAWAWWAVESDPHRRELILTAMVVLAMTGLVNLVPAAPADGFKAVAAALGHLDLGRNARACLADTLLRLAGRPGRVYGARLRAVYVSVAVVNLAIYAWLVGAVVWFCLERLPSPAGELALAALLAYALTMSALRLASPTTTP